MFLVEFTPMLVLETEEVPIPFTSKASQMFSHKNEGGNKLGRLINSFPVLGLFYEDWRTYTFQYLQIIFSTFATRESETFFPLCLVCVFSPMGKRTFFSPYFSLLLLVLRLVTLLYDLSVETNTSLI